MAWGSRGWIWPAWLLPALLAGVQAFAAPVAYRVDEQASHFAVITHAEGLGHDHLITARGYTAELKADDADLASSSFSLSVPVSGLAVDDAQAAEALTPRLLTLGVVDEAFPQLSREDRATIGERIRSESQLDAERHPTVTARLTGVLREAGEWNDHAFPRQMAIALTVRGATVTRRVPATILVTDEQVRASAIGAFRFTEFGVEPFSAGLGLVRNADEFHVYVELRATRTAGAHSMGDYPIARYSMPMQ
ncbi:MAG: YceI family protein [Thiohalomonadaceae bacterium]